MYLFSLGFNQHFHLSCTLYAKAMWLKALDGVDSLSLLLSGVYLGSY